MLRWLPLAALVLVQIAYPLASGGARAALTIAAVGLGCVASVGHALATRGLVVAGVLVAVTTGGGLAIEAIGVATGFPFGEYAYAGALGPRVLGVPVVVPLAWTWMAWPAWLAAGQLVSHTAARVVLVSRTAARVVLVSHTAARVVVAGVGLAAWDLFLDPQMVKEGYWRWAGGTVPRTNYLGWLGVALAMMALLASVGGERMSTVDNRVDAPMLALYLWTYAASVSAHAVFLGLPASALWGGLGMGVVAVPLAITWVRAITGVRA